MTHALRYLMAAGFRGQLRSLVRRVRQPRYAAGLVLVALYIGFIVVTQIKGAREHTARVTDVLSVMLTAYLVLGTAWVWLSAGDRSALALTAAEAAFLLPAPVSRRQLLTYKLARSAIPLAFSALFATFMFARTGSALLTTLRGVGAYLTLGTFLVHRIGVSLVRVSQTEHGASAWRRTWLPTAVFAGGAAFLVWSLRDIAHTLSGAPATSWLTMLRGALENGDAAIVLAPFRMALAPMLASSPEEWVRVLPASLLLLALNLLWVFRSDVAFEEAAMQATSKATERLAAYRARGFSGLASLSLKTRRTIPLAASGSRTTAIVWKNYLWLYRSGAFRSALAVPAVAIVLAILVAPRKPAVADILATACPILAVYGLITAPRMVRSDLRNSLQNIAVLKTLPMPGWRIVVGEIMSSASFAAVCEYLLVVAGVSAWFSTSHPPTGADATTVLALAVPAAIIISGVAFTIGNGLTLIFPALSRSGGSPQGFEMMGQAMLGMLAMLLAVVAVFLVPALAGAGIVFWLHVSRHFVALTAGTLSLILLCAEMVLLWFWLGRLLERLEPMDVA